MEVRSNKETSQDTTKLFTGVVAAKVVAMNPNKEELAKLGVNLEKEPEYYGKDKNENDYGRITFYLQAKVASDVILTNISFYFTGEPRFSENTSKYQFIDANGNTAWAESIEEVQTSWFDKVNYTNCYGAGHENFISFIRSWANLSKDSNSILKNPSDIALGKFTEVTKWYKQIAKVDNTVDILLTINNGYQAVYPKLFGRTGITRPTAWKNHLEKEMKSLAKSGLSFNYEFQNKLKFQEFVETFEDVEIGDSTLGNQPTTSEPFGATAASDEDLF